jgi:hypothetical protein
MKVTYSLGSGTLTIGDYYSSGLRAQLYHPCFKIENGTHPCTGASVHFNTSMRFAWNSGYRNECAFALKAFGFGFGISHAQYNHG